MPSPTQAWGFSKEDTAERVLVERGYVIVERNWTGGGAEVDRIAWDGDVLCFVEVRARATDAFGLPSETVHRRKQRRLVRVAMAYLLRFTPRNLPVVRFDVVSIVDGGDGSPSVEVIENAFDAEE